jgi:hypothetical protein
MEWDKGIDGDALGVKRDGRQGYGFITASDPFIGDSSCLWNILLFKSFDDNNSFVF